MAQHAAPARSAPAAHGRVAHAAAPIASPGAAAADGRTARAAAITASPGPASYVERPVPYGLATHACCAWTHVAGPDGHVQRVLPDGCADVVWVEGVRLELAGPATEPVLVDIPPGATVLGVRFGPGAAGPALGLGAHELRDQTVALDALWGTAANVLAERLADAAPAARRAGRARRHAARARRPGVGHEPRGGPRRSPPAPPLPRRRRLRPQDAP